MTTEKIERAERRTLEGVVRSDRMDKTRVIDVARRGSHGRYGKVLSRSTTVYAHDEKNESRAGDRVRVMATRPLSKLKRWRLVEVLERASAAQGAEVAS